MSTLSTSDALAQALALVFGTPPFASEYTTAHIGKVLGKLLGLALSEAEVLAALRQASYATPRPGRGKHLLKWRFTRAELPAGTPRRRRTATPRRPPKREPSIVERLHLKR